MNMFKEQTCYFSIGHPTPPQLLQLCSEILRVLAIQVLGFEALRCSDLGWMLQKHISQAESWREMRQQETEVAEERGR